MSLSIFPILDELRKEIYKIDESMKDKFPAKITTNEIKDEVTYCENFLPGFSYRRSI